ncbi:hypothetical protein ACOMHN_055616 [Nucella lapillus]
MKERLENNNANLFGAVPQSAHAQWDRNQRPSPDSPRYGKWRNVARCRGFASYYFLRVEQLHVLSEIQRYPMTRPEKLDKLNRLKVLSVSHLVETEEIRKFADSLEEADKEDKEMCNMLLVCFGMFIQLCEMLLYQGNYFFTALMRGGP